METMLNIEQEKKLIIPLETTNYHLLCSAIHECITNQELKTNVGKLT